LLDQVDWQAREIELRNLSAELRSPVATEYDCIIGVSGGKDSLRQALYVKNVLGLRPLLVSLGYPPRQVTQRGVDNFSNMIEQGFDCITIYPAPETWRLLMRKAFLQFCNWAKSTEYPLFASVPRLATAYQTRLVFWGENPALQLGDLNTMGKSGWDGNSVRNMNTLKGGSPDWMLDNSIRKSQILQYYYPSETEIDRAGIQIVYLGYFWKDWALIDNANYAIIHGLEVRSEHPVDIGDPYGVTSLDEDWVGMNQMIKYLKFGFGRTTDYVNEEIRRGRITRCEGIELIKLYDGCCGDIYIESFCDFIEISIKKFWEVVDGSVNRKLFKKDCKGKWVRKFEIGVGCVS
jgi:N-acetyl sugar amidotransferase